MKAEKLRLGNLARRIYPPNPPVAERAYGGFTLLVLVLILCVPTNGATAENAAARPAQLVAKPQAEPAERKCKLRTSASSAATARRAAETSAYSAIN